MKHPFFAASIAALIFGLFFLALLSKTPPNSEATFGGVSMKIEYATTEAERAQGLGGRKDIPPDYGMLFIFPESSYYGFWMKDMLGPIDIFWLDDKGQVISVEKDISPATYPDVFYPPMPVRYVLETAAGFARTHGIEVGAPLVLKNSDSVFK